MATYSRRFGALEIASERGSDSPYLDGINATIADAEMNGKNGNVAIRGTMHLEPNAYPGSTWEGRWAFIGSRGTYFGLAVAQGTGEREGMTLFLDLYDAPKAADADAVCATVSYNGYAGVPEDSFSSTEGYTLVSSR